MKGYSQSGLILYGNHDNPLCNPSFLDREEAYKVSVFPFSTLEADLYLPFSLSTLFSPSDDDGYQMDLGKLTDQLSRSNMVMMSLSVGYLNATTTIRSKRWMFRISENVLSAFSFDKELVRFLNEGNKAFTGEWFETNINFGWLQYSSLQGTTSRRFNEKITLGFSAKLYFGKSGMNAHSTLRLFTEEKAEYLDMELSGKVNASLPLERNINPLGNVNGWQLNPGFTLPGYWFDLRNPGLGADIGVDYRYNSRWGFSAALLDLGFISWFGNVNSMNIDGYSRWEGLDISPIIDYQNDEDILEKLTNFSLADSFLFNAFHPVESPFVTLMPAKLILGARYHYSPTIEFAAINQLLYFNGMIRESLFLTGNFAISNQWKITTGFSFSNHSFFNLPVGIQFKNQRLEAALTIGNLWGLAFADFSTEFGSSLSLVYKFNIIPEGEKEQMKYYPFFKPYNRNKVID